MFKNIASDVLGLSDIGAVIKPADYNKVDTDDYVIHEEGEKIYFLIKSKTDEYCFTNRALIHLDGSSAVSKKRLLKRFSYSHHIITDVKLETAGTLDMDIEIKLTMGDHSYSIDVAKNFIAELKDLYKALLKIASIQYENSLYYQYAQDSLDTAANTVGRSSSNSTSEEQFKAINQYAFNWQKQAHDLYLRKDFGEVFEKFINN
jgi:Bacterial PH domain/YvbH-like oligomerisation region